MTLAPSPDDAKTPEELFAQVNGYIAQVHDIIERRDFLELGGLDDFVDYLCQRVMALPPEEAVQYADQLDVLLTNMHELQSHLKAAQGDVRSEIDQLNKQTAAKKAYQTKED